MKQRYHVIDGNQQIPAGLATGLDGQIRYAMKLQEARKTPAGRVELTLELRITPLKENLKPGKFEGPIQIGTNDPEFSELLVPVRGKHLG